MTRGFVPIPRYYKISPSKTIMNDGKGFGGGEATRDPTPTHYDSNDPKGKQTAIFKAETYAEYIARRNGLNPQKIPDQIIINKRKSGVTDNAESYANYMAQRKAKYREKFSSSKLNTYDRTLETDN